MPCTGKKKPGVRSRGRRGGNLLPADARHQRLAWHDLCRHEYRHDLVGTNGNALTQRAVPASRTADFERAEIDADRLARPGPRRSAAADARLVLHRWPAQSTVQHRVRPRLEKIAEGLYTVSMAGSAYADRTTAGAWKSGRRTCSTRSTSRLRSTRRFRAAERNARVEESFYHRRDASFTSRSLASRARSA